MTPLEATRRLDALRIRQPRMICAVCRKPFALGESGHAPDCPLLVLPQIVATLEAGELVRERLERFDNATGPNESIAGGLYVAVKRFVAALKGETP